MKAFDPHVGICMVLTRALQSGSGTAWMGRQRASCSSMRSPHPRCAAEPPRGPLPFLPPKRESARSGGTDVKMGPARSLGRSEMSLGGSMSPRRSSGIANCERDKAGVSINKGLLTKCVSSTEQGLGLTSGGSEQVRRCDGPQERCKDARGSGTLGSTRRMGSLVAGPSKAS